MAAPPSLSPLPLTDASVESWLGMALKGVFSPLVPNVQWQLLQAFGVVWEIDFSPATEEQPIAASQL